MDSIRQKNKDAVVFWATASAYLLFIFFLISGHTHFKIIRSRYVNKTVAFTFFPVRWNVYTRTPMEPVCKLYSINAGKAQLYDLRPFEAKYDFGLKRDYKIIGAEISSVLQDSAAVVAMHPLNLTIPAGADINKYIAPDTMRYNDISSQNVRYLQGKYIITKELPITREEAMAKEKPVKQVMVLPVNISYRQ